MQDTLATTITSRRREQRARGGVPQPVDLLVDRGVLLDVEVLRRDVRLGLVVVVVRDEVLDRVLGEELAELVAELRRQRLVVRDHERGPLDLLDRERHRGRLARAGHPEQRLEAVALLDALRERRERLRLVCDWAVGGVDAELGHPVETSAAGGALGAARRCSRCRISAADLAAGPTSASRPTRRASAHEHLAPRGRADGPRRSPDAPRRARWQPRRASRRPRGSAPRPSCRRPCTGGPRLRRRRRSPAGRGRPAGAEIHRVRASPGRLYP